VWSVNPRPEGRLPALAGLRFGAALALLLFHHAEPFTAWAPAPAEAVRAGGYVWVGLFYVLSGFVLARAHPGALSPGERREFWAARVARLYPAYLLAFVLAAPFALQRWAGAMPSATLRAGTVALASLLLVQAWYPPIARLWNAPGWSTSVVLAFYAAFPFVVARLSRLRRRGLWLAFAGAWGLSLAGPLLWLWLRPDGPVADLTWNEPRWLLALKFHPVPRAGEFLAGVVLGLLHGRGLGLGRAAALAGPLALAAAVAVLAWGGAPYPLLHNGLLVPLFALVILSVASGRGPLARLLGWGPARTLGDASFAIYVLQEPLYMWGHYLAGEARSVTVGFLVAWALGTIAVALVVARLVERPARRALRTLIARPAPSPAPSPAHRAAGPAALQDARPLRP
jgi:peptidoglycan/LPS O-acetylase OafA/YrhL